MSQDTIESLREALKLSPDNNPLRLLLAKNLKDAARYEEAEVEYQEILKHENMPEAKVGLAHIYLLKESYSPCIVVLEEYLGSHPQDAFALELYAKALVAEGSTAQAVEAYQRLLVLNPNFTDEALDNALRQTSDIDQFEFSDSDEDWDALLNTPKISFDDVGGMDEVKKEIEMKIIHPIKHPEIYKAYGKKIGGGILLYGPPGCGKTYLAKATAGQVDAKFISVGLNDILDMWIGNSEKNLNAMFEAARGNTPCVLFFDEIDALGASRTDMKQSSGRHLINQFLQELDGIEADNEGILIVGATNTPWHLDPAFRRPGRFDRIIFIPPPDEAAREAIFRLKLEGKPLGDVDYKSLAKATKEYSGADIEALIDIAVEGKLEEAIQKGMPTPLVTKDFKQAIKKHKPSTAEWFTAARNFALYANESGLYDDILHYMKIKKK